MGFLNAKYLVLKRDDIEKYLNYHLQANLMQIVGTIEDGCKEDGRRKHEYLVVNMDEPVIDEILELLDIDKDTGRNLPVEGKIKE